MTWLDIGNGWRNIFLLSCLVQAFALGCLFCAHGWFVKKSRAACFLTGVAATPLIQYLWMLVMALVWPAAPRLLLIAVLPVGAVILLMVMALRRVRQVKSLWQKGWRFLVRVCHFDKPALICLCFALCLIITISPALIRFMSSMDMVSNGDAGEYLALAQRYCEDRDLGKLLEKNETEGHFRGNSHFPSMELYMSYGLMHTSGQVGYPNDKPVFTGLGMLIFYAAAAYLALLLIFCRERKRWVLLGALLFNLVPDLYFSIAGAPRDIWRILGLLWAVCLFAGLNDEGSWKRYLGKLVLCFAACFTVMSTHVVCFVVLPFIVVAWVIWRWLACCLTRSGGAKKTLLRSIGLALSGAGGTVVAFLGNLWCYRTWGQMSPWRLMSTFTDAPWYSMYMQIEYRAEETSTHLDFFSSMDSILRAYITPIGLWAFGLSVAALMVCIVWIIALRVRYRRQAMQLVEGEHSSDGPIAVFWVNHSPSAAVISGLMGCALLTLLTLAPMTGLLDTPIYSFSGAFLLMLRYTMQWFIFANLMTCASLSALGDLLEARAESWFGRIRPALGKAARRLPAWLCTVLCVVAFVDGVNQTGYHNSIYRYSRTVMENQRVLLDNHFQSRFGLLMDAAALVPEDENILIPAPAYQYALRGEGYLLPSNPVVSLLNLPLEEIEGALAERQIAIVATDPYFWDSRHYSLSTLSDYLNALPPEQIIETDEMRLYLVDASLVEGVQAAYQARYPEEE